MAIEPETPAEIETERCDMKTTVSNPYYNPSSGPSDALARYISAIKKDVTDLLSRPNQHGTNLTTQEREALNTLMKNEDLVIKEANKGGRIVVMNKKDYVEECKKQLSNDSFYQKLDSDPNKDYTTEVLQQVTQMKEEAVISDDEYKLLTEYLDTEETPIFYGLPKIHKQFETFPPLRPIVSQMKSATKRLSEFIDSFLKYQAQKTSSFIKDTKHFLQKIEEINKKKLSENAILVTMDVSSLYTNIDHEEGAEACREKLEECCDKSISSERLKTLILLVLQSTAFRFGNCIYKQVMGRSMGTPMAPNYANIFMAKFEKDVIASYYEKTGLKPHVWFRYIDDVFFVWTHGSDSLNDFISYNQNYSNEKGMRSNIKFEVNQSENTLKHAIRKV